MGLDMSHIFQQQLKPYLVREKNFFDRHMGCVGSMQERFSDTNKKQIT
jgi:hypothetical protein